MRSIEPAAMPADTQVKPLHEDTQGADLREEMQAQEQHEEDIQDAAVSEELVPEAVRPDDPDMPEEAEEAKEPEAPGEPVRKPADEMTSEEAGAAEPDAEEADAAGEAEPADSAAEAVTDEGEEADI